MKISSPNTQHPTPNTIPLSVLIAPDSFKGSLTALQATEAIASGVSRVIPDAILDLLPIADGGEGTVDAFLVQGGGSWEVRVTGPLGEPVDASYGLMDDDKTAVLEAAAVCGLSLVPPDQRDPGVTTTRGLGELLLFALEDRPERIIVGIGGSATNDGGTGMLRALGARFLDSRGKDLPDGGETLIGLAAIDMVGWKWPVDGPEIIVASDVNNPLCGPNGASAVFGPQKGATPEQVKTLDAALAHYAEIAATLFSCDDSNAPGAGAAGGLGFALMAFLGAELRPGVELVLDACRFSERAARADLIVTGEGQLDAQTGLGKAVLGVARAGKLAGKPVVALAGALKGDLRFLKKEGLLAVASIASGPMSLQEMMADAGNLLANAAERMMDSLFALKPGHLPEDDA